MKKTNVLLLSLGLVCASSFYALTQQSNKAADARPPSLIPADSRSAGLQMIDAQTFEVIPADGDWKKVEHLNTPEKRNERFRATWAITNPEDYNAKHPLTKEQQAASARVRPPGVGWEEFEARKTPEQRESDRQARASILNFVNP